MEAIDEKKAKMIANAQQRVSILKEVSIYANNAEGSMALKDVFLKIQEKHGEKISIDTSNNKLLLGFIAEIVPDYDTEKVYASDIKKLVNWYNILAAHCPEVFTAQEESENAVEEISSEASTPEEKVAE